MELWPEEYEGPRVEAREAARSNAKLIAAKRHPRPLDPAGNVRQLRELLAAREIEAPGGSDVEIDGVRCREFRPPDAARAVYLHFHGGGFIAGSPRMSDEWNAALCQRLHVAVVSVDYRLAPEHPFPAAPNDGFTVASWILEHAEDEFGSRRLLIGGESAGAYISVVTLLRLRDSLAASGRFAGANLIYGGYDLSRTPSARGARATDVPDILDREDLELIGNSFLPGMSPEDRRRPEVSPMFADVHGMPPALFTVGLADHLLDDSILLAGRWRAAGNDADLAVYPDCAHGFLRLPIELAKRANERMLDFLEDVLAP